jgi:hypothetical protein
MRAPSESTISRRWPWPAAAIAVIAAMAAMLATMLAVAAVANEGLAALPTPLPAPPPVAPGPPEGCLVCHRGVTGLGNAHQAIGCASCHGGDALTLDRERAHAEMDLVPGQMATAALRCGQSACHQPIVHRVENSLMNTMAGVIAVNRAVFGAAARDATPARAQRLGHSAADTHLRQLCASCHLAVTKDAFGPNTENSRGGGCNACHLTYDRAAQAALADYEARKHAGAGAGANANAVEPPNRHPAIGLDIGNGQCFGCHSRSGRISTNFEGWHEMHDPPAEARAQARPAADHPERYRLLEDGRVFERATADIHRERGMDCIDCHTANEVMGDGIAPARKHEALRVVCEDCHTRPGAAPRGVPSVQVARLDPASRRLIALRGGAPDERRGRAASGEPLINKIIDSGGARLIGKRTGAPQPLPPALPVCAEGGGHRRRSCGSCHTAWAPRCPTCHTSFDPKTTAYDVIADRDVPGAWKEEAGPYRADAPTLGVRLGARAGAKTPGAPGRRSVIETFSPGMVMTLDRPHAMDDGAGKSGVVHTRLYARVEPHTTRRETRACASCHNDPQALGYGRGRLRFESIAPGRGQWRFTPAETAAPWDGLPADAWIPFLGERGNQGKDKLSTRDDARPFSIREQRRILTVGACLTCHAPRSAPMRRSVRAWNEVFAARKPACAVPVWPSM